MRRKSLFYVVALLALLPACASQVAVEEKAARSKIEIRTNVMIPMRDGVKLAANVALPNPEGKFPVIIVRTPYGKGNGENDDGRYHAARGYAFVIQDCRGTGKSGGEWHPGVHERADGLDTHEWVLAQPWCNGTIGTTGGSYLGYTQWIVAPDAGDSLKAMFTIVPLMDWHTDSGYIGGALALGTMMGWGTEMLRPKEGEGAGVDLENWDWDKAYRHLPLSTWDDVVGFEVPFLRDWVAHPTPDSYWAQMSVVDRLDGVRVPNITLSGWFDIFVQQGLDHVTTVMKTSRSDVARRNQHLIIGPWGHGPNWFVGEVDFGSNAGLDVEGLQNRWFDHWLKGEDTDVEQLPPYRIFVMGRNEWRDEQEWPLERTQYTSYYLHSGGSANSLNGDGTLSTVKPDEEPADSYVYDPDNPVPTNGGCLLFGEDFGPQDQTEVEKREDVLVFTSDVLDEELEVTGPVKVVLYAASSAPDTDWTAKLVDVFPDGRPFNFCDGIIRARYRESADNPTLIEPGKVYRYEIDLWATSNVFLPGHRIRVEISSSNFPRFDRNPNTGHEFGADAELQKATQTVYHDAQRPSHILLPLIPG